MVLTTVKRHAGRHCWKNNVLKSTQALQKGPALSILRDNAQERGLIWGVGTSRGVFALIGGTTLTAKELLLYPTLRCNDTALIILQDQMPMVGIDLSLHPSRMAMTCGLLTGLSGPACWISTRQLDPSTTPEPGLPDHPVINHGQTR